MQTNIIADDQLSGTAQRKENGIEAMQSADVPKHTFHGMVDYQLVSDLTI